MTGIAEPLDPAAASHGDSSPVPSMRGWPPLLVAIAEVTSPEVALRLVGSRGGVSVYFPKAPKAGDQLTEIVGLDAATALGRMYGGCSIEIPVLASRRALKSSVASAVGGTADVARQHGCTARYVRMVRAGRRPDERQLDLFGCAKDPV
jgi:hypothetical protein